MLLKSTLCASFMYIGLHSRSPIGSKGQRERERERESENAITAAFMMEREVFEALFSYFVHILYGEEYVRSTVFVFRSYSLWRGMCSKQYFRFLVYVVFQFLHPSVRQNQVYITVLHVPFIRSQANRKLRLSLH